MILKTIFSVLLSASITAWATGSNKSRPAAVSTETMQKIFSEIRTPYKYGLVMVPSGDDKKMDCPSVFRDNGRWYMAYLVFDGRGYETWLAESADLLHWESKGRILSFPADSSRWDRDQRAGYVALQDSRWGGSYRLSTHDGKYWMSYIGGSKRGYEAGVLSIGIACTAQDPAVVHEWEYFSKPVLACSDKDVRWWENHTLFKSSIIRDEKNLTRHRFVMYYNANGDSLDKKRGAERIGMAVSDDMVHWHRFLRDPVINHHKGISGDAYLQRMGDVWTMFYFGAFWNKERSNAFNRFACSYDLVHWTDWDGPDLIAPTEPFDEQYAHKSFVVKWKGVVYHFYCAVNKKQQRGIAVATSRDLGKSNLSFVQTK